MQIVGFLPTTCPDITPIYPIDDHSMPCDWARIGHEIRNQAHHLPMTNQSPDDFDHEVKSISESSMKFLWALVFSVVWIGVLLNAIINGAWIGIVIMIPVSFLYYFVLIKKDAISRW